MYIGVYIYPVVFQKRFAVIQKIEFRTLKRSGSVSKVEATQVSITDAWINKM